MLVSLALVAVLGRHEAPPALGSRLLSTQSMSVSETEGSIVVRARGGASIGPIQEKDILSATIAVSAIYTLEMAMPGWAAEKYYGTADSPWREWFAVTLFVQTLLLAFIRFKTDVCAKDVLKVLTVAGAVVVALLTHQIFATGEKKTRQPLYAVGPIFLAFAYGGFAP